MRLPRMLPRVRGIGCLGCLPFSGLLFTLLPVILIGVLIYWLVSRSKGRGPVSAGAFCSQCGVPMRPGERFCKNCGAHSA